MEMSLNCGFAKRSQLYFMLLHFNKIPLLPSQLKELFQEQRIPYFHLFHPVLLAVKNPYWKCEMEIWHENKGLTAGKVTIFERKDNKCQKPIKDRNHRDMYSLSSHQKVFDNKEIDLEIADYVLNVPALWCKTKNTNRYKNKVKTFKNIFFTKCDYRFKVYSFYLETKLPFKLVQNVKWCN